MPRNWLKSTTFTQWGAIWLYLQDNNVRILIASQNETIANRFMNFIQRMLMTNNTLRTIYPELLKVDKAWTKSNRWGQTYIDLPRSTAFKESTITSIGVGGAAQSGHYDYIFIDDPVGEKQKQSLVELEKVMSWHDNVNELLNNPNFSEPKGSTVQLICTHWFPGDYGCYVREKYPEYQWRIVPALRDNSLVDRENIKWIQDPKAEPDASNWEGAPDGRSKTSYYIHMKANPERQMIFWAQHMNNPEKGDSGLTKFDKNWLQWFRWERKNDRTVVICNKDKEWFYLQDIPLFGMIDPGGFSETKLIKGGSRNAILIGGQPIGSYKKFVVYTHASRFKEPGKFMDMLFEAHLKFKPKMWYIDAAGQQGYIYQDIKEECKRRGVYIPITKLKTDVRRDSKEEDIKGLINPIANGEIHIHQTMLELIGELSNYPQGMTKDLIDMLGKLYREKWKRGESPDWREYEKFQYIDVDFDRGETGYGI